MMIVCSFRSRFECLNFVRARARPGRFPRVRPRLRRFACGRAPHFANENPKGRSEKAAAAAAGGLAPRLQHCNRPKQT